MDWTAKAASWWNGRRIPEPEAMDGSDEVAAYAGAAAQRHLARLDGLVARRAAGLAGSGTWAVDLGCGPAAIPLAVARLRPRLSVVAMDLSLPMLREGREQARRRRLAERIHFVCGSAAALPLRSGRFDLVMSNSLLHHLHDPGRGLGEAVRVASGTGAVFIRDLRRPPRFWVSAHLALFGRHYTGAMRRLFDASVRAAYTCAEVRRLVAPLAGMKVRPRGGAYLEAERSRGWSGRSSHEPVA